MKEAEVYMYLAAAVLAAISLWMQFGPLGKRPEEKQQRNR